MRGDDDRLNAADSAYSALRDDILSGVLKPYHRLTEVTLADRLNMSRTPVREAVKRLLIEGFLTRAPGEGLRVTGLEPDEVQQIFQIRLKLESYGARRAAEHATAQEQAELHQLADLMTAQTPPKTDMDFEVISNANAAFHRTIMLAAKSPRLGAMMSLVINLGLVPRTYRMYGDHDMIRQSRHYHNIAEAISARDSDWAEAAMSSHVLAAAAVARVYKS